MACRRLLTLVRLRRDKVPSRRHPPGFCRAAPLACVRQRRGRACSQELRALLVIRAGGAPKPPPPQRLCSQRTALMPQRRSAQTVTRARARARVQGCKRFRGA